MGGGICRCVADCRLCHDASVLTSFHPRYALPYSVPLFVLAGRLPGAWRRQSSRRRRLVTGCIVSLFASELLVADRLGWRPVRRRSAKDDARGVAAYLKQNAAADDVILIEANDYTLNYYDHGPAQTKMITRHNRAGALPAN